METNERRLRRGRLMVAAAALVMGLGAAACQPTGPVPPPTSTGGNPSAPPTPTTVKVACPAGGSITVATALKTNVTNLLAAAKADRVSLCGSGYRDPQRQIELRKQNCGPTQYDIWEKPSSQCSPPTAIPGTSMHEKGLAIDFTNCSTQSTACFKWLAAHAKTYGLSNLPSEPWHWSTTGRAGFKSDVDHLEHDV